MKKILPLFLSFLSFGISAQTLTIKKVELAGEKIIVHYDLDDSDPNHEYLLNLFASKDNFSAPLQKVKGDVGQEVKAGLDKKIEWNIRSEYGDYKGKLSMEIRGKVFFPFVKIQNFDTKKKYKRGKQYDVIWKPGNTDPVHVELYKGNQRISGDLSQPNNGAYTLNVPAKTKPGSDYRLKFTDAKSTDDNLYTGYFKVTPKIPLLLKVIPAVAVLGGVAAAAGGGGGKDKGSANIALPPLPGN